MINMSGIPPALLALVLVENNLRDGMWCDFMPARVEVLDLRVVGPFVADKESGGDGTTVGIDSIMPEDFFVQITIQIVDWIVER